MEQEQAQTQLTAKKIIFSGIQPSGIITLGNYIGALRNWAKLQQEYDTYYCIVDMHAITVRQEPAELRRRSLELLALYIACGIDPKQNTLFIQSHVHAHAELAWVLGCNTYMGELSRMTQYKEKSAKQGNNIACGLFTYPVLMAADILLYNSDLVPVGDDQKQHLELARDLAIRFNNAYSPTFTVPEPFIAKHGARIMSLQDPTAKMSKSDENENGYISILDNEDTIMRKLRRAVTDSGSEVVYTKDKPGIQNLMTIYSCLKGESFDAIEQRFTGSGYGVFKEAVGQAVADTLSPIQAEFKRLMADKASLESIYTQGAEKAQYVASKTLSKVYRKVGFVQRGR